MRGYGFSTRRRCGKTGSSTWRSPHNALRGSVSAPLFSFHTNGRRCQWHRRSPPLPDYPTADFGRVRDPAGPRAEPWARRPITLRAMREYVTMVRSLLAGDTVTIDGELARMLHAEDFDRTETHRCRDLAGRVRAHAAIGLAMDIADGILGLPGNHALPVATLMPATVLKPGEDRDSARVREAVGPWKVVTYHEAYAIGGPDAVDALPGGRRVASCVGAARSGRAASPAHLPG